MSHCWHRKIESGMFYDYIHCRYGLDIWGDMAEVWKTKCLQEFPFPEFENEKLCSEDVVWISMAQKYKMHFYNIVIFISDYLEGVLTRSRCSQNLDNYSGNLSINRCLSLCIRFQCSSM